MKIVAAIFIWVICFTAKVGYSQSDQWAWVTGDSTANTLAIHGQLGVPSQNNKPGGKSGAYYWRDKIGNIWLFGGSEITQVSSSQNYRSDLWKFDISTNNWTWVKGDSAKRIQGNYGVKGVASITNKPGARQFGNYWTDTVGRFWMFGGSIVESSGLQSYGNDLWEYNTTTDMWTWVSGNRLAISSQLGVYGTRGVPSAANYPGARRGSSSCVDKAGNLWLYGGDGQTLGGNSGKLSDLWMFNTTTREWTWIAGDTLTNIPPIYGAKGSTCSNCYPGSRQYCTIAIDSNFLWLFAGETFLTSPGYGRKNDIWKYDLSNGEWIWLSGDTSQDAIGNYGILKQSSASNKPGSRIGSASWSDSYSNLWVFGGLGFGATSASTLGDMWKFNKISNEWTWMSGDSSVLNYGVFQSKGLSPNNKAGGRGVSCLFVDQNGYFWMGGGQGFASTTYGKLNDFWYYIPDYSVMPIHLIKFTATLQDQTTHLLWTADNEQNFSHYEIQRSTNSREFNKVGSVQSKKRSEKNEYSFEDFTPLPFGDGSVKSIYYRLKMVDNDGTFTYSNIAQIKLPVKNGFTVYPNPATTAAQLQFSKPLTGKANLTMTDATGKTVLTTVFNGPSSMVSIATINLPAGIYRVKVMSESGTFTGQVVVIK